ncbi:hypothetical protein OMCYN_01446 [cyanobiont of Ornithocercus magnificus]|nr:hypothetical protein OMCYN_01446 [cyanobiont of Ornithocercus magnificus]
MGFYLVLDSKITMTPLLLQPTREPEEESEDKLPDSSIPIDAALLSEIPPLVVTDAVLDADAVKNLAEKPEQIVVTTAEAMAAELAATAKLISESPVVTYAPEALCPGAGRLPNRRKPGANLRPFRSMVADLFKKN